jgi:leader peptidase (prepilin peptidase) / N-methyltransferase
MLIAGIVFAVLLGLLIGSFLNVCIDRLPAQQSLVSPPSHCSACGRRLAVTDLVPVFSYLFLRGRCRYCGAALPKRMMLVEAGTGILFGFLFWHYGLTVELAMAMAYASIFIVLTVIDLDHQLILNVIVYPAIILALALSLLVPPSRMLAAGGSAFAAPAFLPEAGIAQAAIGAGIGLAFFVVVIVVSRGGMGWGDAKLAALIGAITGYLVPLAIFLAIITGGLIAVFLLVFKLKKRKEGIPFGPYLALGAMITVIWGNGIAGWYLGAFG